MRRTIDPHGRTVLQAEVLDALYCVLCDRAGANVAPSEELAE
jgi:hypothetical protein